MSWLDILPSSERQRIREKLQLSPAQYEKLREKVKGPEDLEREMGRNEVMAELKFGIESEPALKDALKTQVEADIAERGMEGALELRSASPEAASAIEKGKFDVSIEAPSADAPEQLVLIPEGTVAEKIPISKSLTEAYVGQLLGDSGQGTGSGE